MPFQFVDNGAVCEPATRRRIRSQAALGKNLGKKIVRPSKKRAPEQKDVRKDITFKTASDAKDNEARGFMIERQVGDGLSVFSIPEQSLKSKGVVKRVFTFMSGPRHAPELANALQVNERTPASIWVELMFMDQAYFHCAIAISTTALNAHVVQPDLTGAIYHLSHAFRFMNEKLSGDDALSDTTIAVAVMLAKYEPLCGHHSQGLVHLQAVHRMVHLRGGIAHFTKNRPNISQKIFRSDLDYSLHMGTPTRFTVDDVLKDTVAVVGVPGHIYSQYDWYSDQTPKVLAEGHLSTDLRDLFINNIHLAHMLNDGDAKRGPKLNTYAFHETTILIGYRLVSFSTLGGSRPTNSLENIVHLGLMAFIVSFLRGLDRRITDVPLLSELSRHAAQKAYDGEREDLEVLLWTLFIGTPSVYAPQDEEWLVPKTVDTMRALSLRSWDDVLGILTKFPWVHVVHDQGGRALWHKAAARANTRTGIGFTL